METNDDKVNASDDNSNNLAHQKPKNKFSLILLGGFFPICLVLAMLSAVLLAVTPFKKGISIKLPGSQNQTSLIPTNISRPINILVLGIDNSGHPHESNFTPAEAMSGNSDTMLLVRLIPDTHQINVLSIPRDTLVQISGHVDKINDANVVGGTELAAKSVSQLLGNVPIDHYIRLDTEGFIHLVDALGDVEVNIPKAMHYEDKTQHLSINFDAGKQKLNGQHLEEYIRFRHDALGDIGRVQRQQEVLKALLQKLLQPSTVAQVPKLLSVVKDNVDTDLSLGEMLGTTQFISHIDKQHLNLVMLPGRFSDRKEYKLSYWISDPKATLPILAKYFDIGSNQIDTSSNDNSQFKTIRLAVINGTIDETKVSRAASFLTKRGFGKTYVTHHEIDSGNFPVKITKIIAQKGNVEAANAVKDTLGFGEVEVNSTGDIASDITVVVGEDWQ